MSFDTLEIKRIDETFDSLPARAHKADAGLDLCSAEDVQLSYRGTAKIRTGISVAIPEGYVGLVLDRSSMGLKGLKVMGGVIDSGYRGEVCVILADVSDGIPEPGNAFVFGPGKSKWFIKKGQKIAQLVILPIALPVPVLVKEFSDTSETTRGSGGFGSTGA